MSQAAASTFAPDLVLGRYRPLRPLGSGASGSVWLARDERSGLDVALKIVPRDGKAGERAEREAAAAARLRHPRCLRAYAFGRDRGHVYIAYEYAPGRTMREALRSRALDDHGAVEAAAQILDGLAHAHANGIVHRDVKPANALLADSDDVDIRLLDFGLARIAGAHTLTARGDVPGTLAYVAPERLAGDSAGPPSDVWSVGVLLWEALAGEHPFWRTSPVETARAIETGPPPLVTSRPDLPRELLDAVDSALALDPSRRPTAAALAARLRGAEAQQTRPRRITRAPRLGVDVGLAALVAGWSALALPFFPLGLVPALAAVAAIAAAIHARLGVAVALAVPVLPLGNHSLALALVYAGVALVWLAVFWTDARIALRFAVGPLLGIVSATGLLPILATGIRTALLRACTVVAGIAAACVVAGIRGSPLPLTGTRPPESLDLARSESPVEAAAALARVVSANPQLAAATIVLAAAAAVLPFASRFGAWGIAGFGAAILAATLLPAPQVAALPLIVCTWATCFLLAAADRRQRGA